MAYMDAGKLRETLEVLELRETAPAIWEWVPIRRTWAQVEQSAKTNLFSQVGLGARDAAMVIRRQPLTLHNAMRWRGQHLFVTAITQRDRNYLDVAAALVEVDAVILQDEGLRFPGVLTEKYVRFSQEWPMSENEHSLVLVTPKQIRLQPGSLVEARGNAWEVLMPHELDAYKNEYELGRRVDL